MTRQWKVILGFLLGMGVLGSGAGVLLSYRQPPVPAVVMLAPSPTIAPTETAVPTTNTPMTPSMTPTATLTASHTPSVTFTLATRLIQITAIHPDVALDGRSSPAPTLTPTRLPTLAVPSPGATLGDVPTGDSVPVIGWRRYSIDHPALQKTGAWEVFTSTYRSANRRYLYTDAVGAKLMLRFLGAAVRVRYARFASYGVFEVRIDGQVVTTVDAYLPKVTKNGDFVTTDVYGLANGWHTLEILRLDRHHPDSTGGFIAIDGIDIYQSGAAPTLEASTTPRPPTFTPSPAPVQKLQVLVAPPTIQPTLTPAPPQLVAVTLTVVYDQNGNKAAEPGEGVGQLPVQLVRADTNQVVASGLTNTEGYVRLEATGTAPLRLVVPYFNRFWDITPTTSGTRLTLLLPPTNRPALIP